MNVTAIHEQAIELSRQVLATDHDALAEAIRDAWIAGEINPTRQLATYYFVGAQRIGAPLSPTPPVHPREVYRLPCGRELEVVRFGHGDWRVVDDRGITVPRGRVRTRARAERLAEEHGPGAWHVSITPAEAEEIRDRWRRAVAVALGW